MRRLPYRAHTATGTTFDIEFPLHAATADPVKVSQLLSAVLETVWREMSVLGETSNGDVLQALAMALAVRSGMIHTDPELARRLTHELVATALDAMQAADTSGPTAGHA